MIKRVMTARISVLFGVELLFAATTCQRKTINYQKRVDFAPFKINDENDAPCLDILVPELPF